ncbi:hypothetical protein I7I50_09799 [Histoplasma capsulatum G186AR]|uniref:Uncharacterized protein n=1 Tax=Ajellomyces capsulatus TaxID=5037 RepID=A0A8H7YYE3_AJECA|nr:hypothetical protein I7I52_10884 [Histoplasma capsulatum]QSS68734.1 hypothetical protein I7I50_09799 [Histoplasma capsulatum G186AR]
MTPSPTSASPALSNTTAKFSISLSHSTTRASHATKQYLAMPASQGSGRYASKGGKYRRGGPRLKTQIIRPIAHACSEKRRAVPGSGI